MGQQPQVHRATNKAPDSLGSATGRDVHFIKPSSASRPSSIPSSSPPSRGMLQELSAGQAHNKSLAWNSPQHNQKQKLYLKSGPIKLPSKTSSSRGPRRPTVDSDTFEPLDAVLEESIVSGVSAAATTSDSLPLSADQLSPKANPITSHPLANANPQTPTQHQFQNHLAGQFEWVLSFSAPASHTNDHGSHDNGNDDRHESEMQVYGCNLLSREPRSSSPGPSNSTQEADIFTLLATPLMAQEYLDFGLDLSDIPVNTAKMTLPPPPAYELHQTIPLKVPEVVEVVEAVSPSLTLISERSSSYAGSSRNGSFSVPRIEDSFEELDKLEDELEAINAVTQPRRIALPENTLTSTKHLEPPSANKKSTISKRASMAGMSSTVRIKQSERTQPSLRRSTSLVFREKKQDELESTPGLKPQASRGKLANSQFASLKAPIKSTKLPTVPNFELPGEAVARRLKEQREARRTQQADAQKAYVPPPRPKSSKPLTKPNFELPGEAISRRKREEREARLKAQEEEEQKKREFRARPVRNSIIPATMPRETLASLARQGKLPQDDTAKQSGATKPKRVSNVIPRAVPTSEAQVSQTRGRLSTATSREDLSRGTSASTGSGSVKRTTLTAEQARQFKIRGREIFQRDNTSYTQDREREKREREEGTRLAREQAAERSRIASREWAEKKRRKEQAMMESLRGQ
ncbi:hypothetical protein FSARC_5701 [Fusarium sarcochroum]|uniref:Carboxylesterase family protein n=1 Tax=Fusarium sarcochroum TaxID=1208366 RepID=A0A8H4TZ29_9HYPO|nr:hypothetical protein FSARC_5701 [Fusarium sarcochroum]